MSQRRDAGTQRIQYFLFASLHLCAFALIFLAFVLRFHLLGAQSLWNDEGNSYVQATRSFSEIAFHAGRDIHPPGYYWLLAAWRMFTGDSEFALRSLSAFVSVLSVAFAFVLGKRLYGGLAGLAAAAFVALNTFSIFYAQEARMYALLALWGAAAMWAFVGFVQTPTRRWALVLGLFNAAGLWTQYAFPFVMLAQGVLFVVWLLVGTRHVVSLRRIFGLYVGANLLAIALFAAWLPTALQQVTSWPNTGEGVPLDQAFSVTMNWLTFGMTYAERGTASWIAVVWFLLLFGLLQTPGNKSAFSRWALLVPIVWAVVSVGLFLALGMFREGNLKLLLPVQIAAALWVARGLWVLATWDVSGRSVMVRYAPRLAALMAVFGLLVTMSGGLDALYHGADYQRDDYRAIVQSIDSRLRDGDAVVLDAPNQEEVFGYYYRGEAPIVPLPPGLGGNDDETREAVQQLIADYARIFVVFWGEAERDPNRVVETTLDANAYEVANTWYGDVRLAEYVTPDELGERVTVDAQFGEHITLESYALNSTTVHAGDVLQVRLDWSTDAPIDTRYKVFVQLLNPDGSLATQRDSEPGGGLALTTTWMPDETVTDNHALSIPAELAPGDYSLIVGLYALEDAGARLPVTDGDYLLLTTIRLT